MPVNAVPPDKVTQLLSAPSLSASTNKNLIIAIVPKKDESDVSAENEVKDSMAKPLSVPSRAGSENPRKLFKVSILLTHISQPP